MKEQLKELIDAARGITESDLVLKNGKILNVFTGEIESGDVAVKDGVIVGIGSYKGKEEIDVSDKYICPGLIDGHIHIESSMLSPAEFAKAVIPHGTTAVIADPHEIANVAGIEGIEYMLEASKDLPIDIFFMLPSCVPATGMDESGAVLKAGDLERFYKEKNVKGLAELMNSFGTVRGDEDILDKIAGAVNAGKVIDGHAPGLAGNELNAYITAGVESDHECSDIGEALEKLRRGQWIMVREGTAAKNMDNLIPLFDDDYCGRCMIVTDDKHPGDIVEFGHMDYLVRKAVRSGKKASNAVKMASLNPSMYFGLGKRGAVAPGYKADIIVVSGFDLFKVEKVFKDGKLVAEDGVLTADIETKVKPQDYPRIYNSFNMDPVKPEDLRLKKTGSSKRVLEVVKGELLTNEIIVPSNLDKEPSGIEIDKDILKIAVIERHKKTGHVGIGFIRGYGLKSGAIASSVAHDSHNIIVVGTNDEDMAAAANEVLRNRGGLAITEGGKVKASLALPIAGLMCEEDAVETEDKLIEMKVMAKHMGCTYGIDPFMTLAFTALPVIPKLRILTQGLFDVPSQSYVPEVFD
ncbi:MAG: adenine deaminase [Saccharofermentans sp.]|nr:adenine deaminase [Saccharofermentans sp.]